MNLPHQSIVDMVALGSCLLGVCNAKVGGQQGWMVFCELCMGKARVPVHLVLVSTTYVFIKLQRLTTPLSDFTCLEEHGHGICVISTSTLASAALRRMLETSTFGAILPVLLSGRWLDISWSRIWKLVEASASQCAVGQMCRTNSCCPA